MPCRGYCSDPNGDDTALNYTAVVRKKEEGVHLRDIQGVELTGLANQWNVNDQVGNREQR